MGELVSCWFHFTVAIPIKFGCPPLDHCLIYTRSMLSLTSLPFIFPPLWPARQLGTYPGFNCLLIQNPAIFFLKIWAYVRTFVRTRLITSSGVQNSERPTHACTVLGIIHALVSIYILVVSSNNLSTYSVRFFVRVQVDNTMFSRTFRSSCFYDFDVEAAAYLYLF